MLGTHPAPPRHTKHKNSCLVEGRGKKLPAMQGKKKMLAVTNETRFWRNGSCGKSKKKKKCTNSEKKL